MVLIRRTGEQEWESRPIQPYPNEQTIQIIIEESLGQLPGMEDVPTRTVREYPVPLAGFIDVLAVDLHGNITVVECKLRANPESRRWVIGQVLAYGAGLWKLSYEEFDRRFATRAAKPLAQLFAETAETTDETWNESTFRAAVEDNLTRGRFRLVIAVDEITEELERIVMYLQEQTHPEIKVVALEVGYISHAGVEILIPTAFGGAILPEASTASPEASIDSITEQIARAISASPRRQKQYKSRTLWSMYGFRRRTPERINLVKKSLRERGIEHNIESDRFGWEGLGERITFQMRSQKNRDEQIDQAAVVPEE